MNTHWKVAVILVVTALACGACGGTAEVQEPAAPVTGSEAAVKAIGKFDHSKFNLAVFQ